MTINLKIIFNGNTFAVLMKAYGWTIAITAMALVLGVLIGTVLAIFKVLPQKNLLNRILNGIAEGYITVIRGTPIVVQLMIIYFVIFAGVIFINREISPFIIATIGFGLNSGAYVAEIMRGGILGVDKGQMEAGRALGLGYGTTMTKIVIPQAAKNVLPPLGNEAIVLLKETSVALIIGVSEFFTVVKGIAAATYNVITPYLFAAVIYLVTVMGMAALLKKFEKKLRRGDAR